MNSMKSEKNGKIWFLKGMKHGIPIGLGYFAVSFTLGIAAKKAGLSAFQAAVMSAAMMASAGQFAGIGMIAAGAGYLEMAVTTLVVNMRYLLMSSALSQKVRRDVPFYHRFLMAYEVTDEIFGIAVSFFRKVLSLNLEWLTYSPSLLKWKPIPLSVNWQAITLIHEEP